MNPTEPRIRGRKIRIAEDQPEFEPVTVVAADNPNYKQSPRPNTVIMAFEPTPEERQQIINGADVYVALLTYGMRQQPIMITVGPEAMAELHGLEVQGGRPDATGTPTDAEGAEDL